MFVKLTRRQVLKLIATATATATLSPLLHARAQYLTAPSGDRRNDEWELRGRAIYTLSFYEKPDTKSERLETLARDKDFQILGEVHAPFSKHNDLWYRTPLGYVHSAWVLPVKVYPPQPFVADIGEWGIWGEVSQIYTEAYTHPNVNSGRRYRFYGGTVFYVVEAFEDEEGTGWYKVVDDYPPKTISYQWVLAKDMRRIPRAELAPIHPFVGDKRIEVDLAAQTLTCFEGEESIFETKVASGYGEFGTVTGEKCVLLKQASRHMSNVPYTEPTEENPAPDPSDIFDLPGVPWNTFFDLDGSAIHGAYWHNDFGLPRSHGCLNVPIDAARFVYLWTHPIGGYEDEFIQSDCRVGTKIRIF
ncbi:MAG: L,D-transpeptidase [Anaerolineae bacterium]|nr:L,D-transpeptidase [Anaerolineae bacterium]